MVNASILLDLASALIRTFLPEELWLIEQNLTDPILEASVTNILEGFLDERRI